MKASLAYISYLTLLLLSLAAGSCQADNQQSSSSQEKSVHIAVYEEAQSYDSLPDTLLMTYEDKAFRLPAAIEKDFRVDELEFSQYDTDVLVSFKWDKQQWRRLTSNNIQLCIAITLDGNIVSAPRIKAPIENGNCSFILPQEAYAEFFPDTQVKAAAPRHQLDTDPISEMITQRYLILTGMLLVIIYVLLLLVGKFSARVRVVLGPVSMVFFPVLLLIINWQSLHFITCRAPAILLAGCLLFFAIFIWQCLLVIRIARKEIKTRQDVEKRTIAVNSLIFILAISLTFLCVAVFSTQLYGPYSTILQRDWLPDNWIQQTIKFAFFFTLALALTDSFIRRVCSPVDTADAVPHLNTFNLYLRSFDADNSLAKKEKKLCQFFDRYFPTYAIGNPNSVLQPLGANRIYVSDAEWKDTVSTMMNKARMIIMRCASTDGAAWELQKLMSAPELYSKCIFVVDSQESLDLLCQALRDMGVEAPEATLKFEGQQYGVAIRSRGPQVSFITGPLDSEKDLKAFFSAMLDSNFDLRSELKRKRSMRKAVMRSIFSDDVPQRVRHSMAWSIVSPVICWRHWPWYWWLIVVAAVCLSVYLGPIPLLVLVLFSFFLGNRIEWVLTTHAGASTFLKEQHRIAWLMWGSLILSTILAVFTCFLCA